MDFSKPIDFSRTLPHGGGVSGSHDDDLDGIPMDDDVDGEPMEAIPLAKDDSPRAAQLSSGESHRATLQHHWRLVCVTEGRCSML